MAKNKKVCRHCKSEINVDAKRCPICRGKQSRPIVTVLIVLLFLIVGVVAFYAGSGQNPFEDVTEKTYAVGDSVEINGVTVKFVGVTESQGTEFFQPESGNVFVLPEFEIKNGSSNGLNMSTIMNFDAYVDGYSTALSLSAISVAGAEQLDGTIAAGKNMKGVVGYEVPANYKDLEISVSLDVWSSKKLTFKYAK